MTTTSGDKQAEVLDLGFDPDALREKYRLERDKRLRPDGIAQYRPPTGDFSRYVEDPYVAPGFRRDPLVDEVDAVVVGGGIGGLLAGARLRQAGLGRVRIVDKAGDFGGTWYWNRYPGAQCDIESYIYLPLLEETGYIPTEKYARGPEILEYLQSLGRRFDLYEDACFQTEITDVWWDDADGRWVVRTDRDDQIRARFVVLSTGLMSRAKLPGIPGIESYKGHSFHTSRWDYEYTGGGTDGGLVGLAGKRVAVVGTGASAVQCVPHVAASAEHLYVFQRTPSSISERGNAPTDPAWASSLEPGWHEERMTNFNILVSGGHQDVDLVGDGWTDLFRHVQGFLAREAVDPGSEEAIATALELADFTKMEQLRARIDATVEDPATAEVLKPYYRMFCKRPCFSDDYLPTFNRPNVTLVDTGGQGVERFTENGAVIDGQEYELDCVIFATGFEIGTDFTRRIGFDVVGRDGVKLSEKWAEGLSTFHGFYTHGFPNMFFLGITQTGLTPNVQHMLDEQTQHVGRVLQHSQARGATRVEASLEAERAWCETMRELAVQNSFLLECTPGYYNQEGRPTSSNSLFSGQYGAGSVEFFGVLRQWCDEGSFAGLDIQ